jgi:hypothetical protein
MKLIKVNDFIYRGDRPKASKDFDLLRDQGFQVILNLERGWLDFWLGLLNYEIKSALFKRHGFDSYSNEPIFPSGFRGGASGNDRAWQC